MKKVFTTLSIAIALLGISSSAFSENWKDLGLFAFGQVYINDDIITSPNAPHLKETWYKTVPYKKKEPTVLTHFEVDCQSKRIKETLALIQYSNGSSKKSEDTFNNQPTSIFPHTLEEKLFTTVCKTPREEFSDSVIKEGPFNHIHSRPTPTENGMKVWDLFIPEKEEKAPKIKLNGTSQKVMRAIILKEYNCSSKRIRLLKTRTELIDGSSLILEEPTPWNLIVPDSYESKNFERFCKTPILTNQ